MSAQAVEHAQNNDYISFTFFIALALHAILILGTDFGDELRASAAHTLEITLALHKSENTPKKADFLAQFNQTGSGSEEEKAEISTDHKADFHSDVINKVQMNTPTAPTVNKKQSAKIITSTASSRNKIAPAKKQQDELELKKAEQLMLQEKTQQIASLEAQLRKQKQAYAKRPRIRHVTSVTTLAHKEAEYLQVFRERIEDVGNRNFPRQALSKKLYGATRLLVAINADGSLREVELRKSSGITLLDEAAIASVRLAAPFDPFPADMKRDTDILEIIRTWKFDEKQLTTNI